MHGNLQTRTVSFPVEGGGQAAAYEARPGGAGSYPGVIIVHEWWGLNEHIQDVARRLAHEGFVALAPDLYEGRVTTDADLASSWMKSLNTEQALKILLGAVHFLQGTEPTYAQHIGVMGFCMGGTFALLLPCRTEAIKAAAPFYGDTPDPIDQVGCIRCPVLFIAGAKDQWINTAKVNALKASFQKYNVHGEVRVYPDAGHAFFNNTRPEVYSPASAQDAWMRALGLFSRTLKS